MVSELNPPRWIYQLLEWWELSWTFPRIHSLQQSRFFRQLKAKQSKLQAVNFTSVSNCWSTEAGQGCSKQSEKLLDIKHTNILINISFDKHKRCLQHNSGAVFLHPVFHGFAFSLVFFFLILSSWKIQRH